MRTRSRTRIICIMTLLAGILALSEASAQNLERVRREADYILACQYIKKGNAASGAINDIYGAPTWVVPRENALAILGLMRAYDVLGDSIYRSRADEAMKYLLGIQASDGGWYDQYDYLNPVQWSKSPTQTAEVMIALNKLGYRRSRYDAMARAADFLIDLQNPARKTGLDDGLVCGGLDAQGNVMTWRWASDNAFAYQALRAAALWADSRRDWAGRARYDSAAAQVLNGLNTVMKNQNSPVWHAVVDAQGVPVPGRALDWVNYAPQMLDVPAVGVGDPAVGEWIYSTLVRLPEGGVVWNNGSEGHVLSPGYSFQASLVWIDLGQQTYSVAACAWALNSGLYQQSHDGNGITGGWIDWVETTGNQAPWWERFIDTSFYWIAVETGGYDFSP